MENVDPSQRSRRATRRRAVGLGLAALAVVSATACSSSTNLASSDDSSSDSSPATSIATDEAETTGATPLPVESVDPVAATDPPAAPTADTSRLTAAGIEIDDAESDAPVDPAHPLRLTTVQAERLAADVSPGSGVLGSQLDAMAPVPEGTPPTSYLVAAWVVSGTSVGAGTARGWMGEQDWSHAPSVVFPMAVVAMFVNEIAADTAQLPVASGVPTTDAAAAEGAGTETIAGAGEPTASTGAPSGFAGRSAASPALPASPCSAVTGYLSSVFNGLFDALKISPAAGDGGALDIATSVLATVWNVAVGLAKGALENLITELTAPVFNAIRTAVGALGVATVVLSYFKDQTLDVDLQTPQTSQDQYPFAVGDGPDVTGTFVAKGRELTGDWPPALTDCAKVAGAELPQLIAPGSPANWTVDASDLIVPGPLEGVVAPDNQATLTFHTGRESADDAKGEATYGIAYVSVKIPRKEVEDFLDLAKKQIDGVKAQLLSLVPEPLQGAVKNLMASTIDPTVAQLSNTIGGAVGGPLAVEGSSRVVVMHHQPPDTTIPEPEPTEPDDDGGDGDFCAQYVDMSRWTEANASSDFVAFGSELSRRLDAMRPSAPAELVGYVDTLRGIYGALAAGADPITLGDQAEALGEAARVLGTYCGLG